MALGRGKPAKESSSRNAILIGIILTNALNAWIEARQVGENLVDVSTLQNLSSFTDRIFTDIVYYRFPSLLSPILLWLLASQNLHWFSLKRYPCPAFIALLSGVIQELLKETLHRNVSTTRKEKRVDSLESRFFPG